MKEILVLLASWIAIGLSAQESERDLQYFKVDNSYYTLTLGGLDAYTQSISGADDLKRDLNKELKHLRKRRLGGYLGVGAVLTSIAVVVTSWSINENDLSTEINTLQLTAGSLLMVPGIIGLAQWPPRAAYLRVVNLHNEHQQMKEPIILSACFFSSLETPAGFGLALQF